MPDDPGATYGIITHALASDILNNGFLRGNNQSFTGDNAEAVAEGRLAVGAGSDVVPNTPGRALGMADADLIAAASAGGTYFTSATQFDAWVAGLGGAPAPNTSPIYLAFSTDPRGVSPLNRVTFDPDRAYIVINHMPAGGVEPAEGEAPNGIATTGNVHVDLRGILILDDAMHVNASSVVNGALISLHGTPEVQVKFGQGGAAFNYSSAAIGRALRDGISGALATYGAPRMVWFREGNPSDADAYAVLEASGISTAGMPAVTALSGWSVP